MADAVGHGMPAALLTMFIKNAMVLKQITADGYRLLDPGEALGKLNDSMVEQNLSHATFATAVYGMVDSKTLTCRFARAGHPSPLLMRADGSVQCLETEGGLLGIFEDESYMSAEIQLQKGDRVFVYSDGMEVAFAEDQSFDSTQWRRELTNRRELSTEQLLTELSGMLDSETGSLQPRDDVSMIVVEVR
jgi:sigma-B regulation protein RsbU (phosphoserine phosphatase)